MPSILSRCRMAYLHFLQRMLPRHAFVTCVVQHLQVNHRRTITTMPLR